MATLQDVLQALNKVAGSINKTGQAFTSGVANAGRNLGVGAYGGYRLGRAGVSGARALPFFNRQTAMGQVGALGGAAAGASVRAAAQQATAAKLGYNHASKLRQIAAMQQQSSKLTAMVQGNPRLMAHRAKVEALRQKYEDAKTAHAARPTAQSMRRVGIRQKKYEEENQKLNLNPLHAKQTKSLQELTNAQRGYEKQLKNLLPLQKFSFQVGRVTDGLSRLYDPLKQDTATFAKRALLGGIATTTALAYKGFGGTVEGARSSNESMLLSREVSAIFSPLLETVTGFTRGIRKNLEGLSGSDQKKLMYGGLAVAGGTALVGTGTGRAVLGMGARALPSMIGGGIAAGGAAASGIGSALGATGSAIGTGASAIGAAGAGTAGAAGGAVTLAAGSLLMRYNAYRANQRSEASGKGDTEALGLKGDEYGYKDKFSKISDLEERRKAILEEQTSVARSQGKDEYVTPFHRGVRDVVNSLGFGGGKKKEMEERAAILQKQQTEIQNEKAGLAPDGKPKQEAPGDPHKKLLLDQAGFGGAGSSFEELQSEVLRLTPPASENEKKGEEWAGELIKVLSQVSSVLSSLSNPFGIFGSEPKRP